jgi:hypothetical protein
MSGELHVDKGSEFTVYACVRDEAGDVGYHAGPVFEEWGSGDPVRTAANYAISCQYVGGNRHVGNFPTWCDAGRYTAQFYVQLGGAPADSDGEPFAGGPIRWSGGAEVTDVEQALDIDTLAEPSAVAPPVAPTVLQVLNYLYRLFRNKRVTDKGPPAKQTLYKDDGSTPMIEATLSDDGTLFTKGEFEAP